MIRFILQWSLEIIIGLTLVTQVLIPIFIPELKFFWLFRKKEKKKKPNNSTDDER